MTDDATVVGVPKPAAQITDSFVDVNHRSCRSVFDVREGTAQIDIAFVSKPKDGPLITGLTVQIHEQIVGGYAKPATWSHSAKGGDLINTIVRGDLKCRVGSSGAKWRQHLALEDVLRPHVTAAIRDGREAWRAHAKQEAYIKRHYEWCLYRADRKNADVVEGFQYLIREAENKRKRIAALYHGGLIVEAVVESGGGLWDVLY